MRQTDPSIAADRATIYRRFRRGRNTAEIAESMKKPEAYVANTLASIRDRQFNTHRLAVKRGRAAFLRDLDRQERRARLAEAFRRGIAA